MPKEIYEVYLNPACNPFTPRQAEIINRILWGKRRTEVEKELDIAHMTMTHHFTGNMCTMYNDGSIPYGKAESGIYGILQKLAGERPGSVAEAIRIMIQHDIIECKEIPEYIEETLEVEQEFEVS